MLEIKKQKQNETKKQKHSIGGGKKNVFDGLISRPKEKNQSG